MLKNLKNDNVALLLLLTILLGVVATAFEFPQERFVHPSGKEGHYLNYYFHFTFSYIIGFVFVAIIIMLTTGINRIIACVYLFWDFVGFLLYQYNGWPEPKMLIIIAFSVTLILYIFLKKWK